MSGINVLNFYNPIGDACIWGDSRLARTFQSLSNNFGFSGYTALNWAQARIGHRLKIKHNSAVAGDHMWQMLNRVPTLIGQKCGTLVFRGGVNDCNDAGVGFTNQNTVGPNQGIAVTSANVDLVISQMAEFAFQQFIMNGGQRILIFLESGGEVFGSGQLGSLIRYNNRLREIAERIPGAIIFDAFTAMVDWNASGASIYRGKAGYFAEVAGSGVHESNLGAYAVSAILAPILSTWPAIPRLPSSPFEVTTNTTEQLLLNSTFMAGGGGTAGAGASGTIPLNWTLDRTGGTGTQTCVCSIGVPADGSPGKEAILVCTFGGAGDIIRFRQDVVIGNINVGDFLQADSSMAIDAGGALAGIQMDGNYSDGSVTWNLTDLKPLDNNPIGVDGGVFALRTPVYPVTVKGGGAFYSSRHYAIGSAAGTATVRLRSTQVSKRASL